MSIPLFWPSVRYVPRLNIGARATTLRALCDVAGVPCRASGAWTNRIIDVIENDAVQIVAEPDDWSAVQIFVPSSTQRDAARLALAALAYALHDPVAKQSIQGAPWARIAVPRGRIATSTALSSTVSPDRGLGRSPPPRQARGPTEIPRLRSRCVLHTP
jgi:hypothetical protein